MDAAAKEVDLDADREELHELRDRFDAALDTDARERPLAR